MKISDIIKILIGFLFLISGIQMFTHLLNNDDKIICYMLVLFGLLLVIRPIIKIKNLINNQKNNNRFNYISNKQIIDTIKNNQNKMFKNSKLIFTNLQKAEFIMDYTHGFSSDYLLYNGLTDWIKSMNFNERLWFVINSCNKTNPSTQERFLLALAYNDLGSFYNEYAIYYLKQYVERHEFYNKRFSHCETQNDIINYQWCLFNFLLSNKYLQDMQYDEALKYAFVSKGMSNDFAKPYYALFSKRYDDYGLISEILYKKNNIKRAITNLYDGINQVKDNNLKSKYYKQIEKYNNYLKDNKIYKPTNKKRIRLDMNTNHIYNLTTGEIIQ